MPLKGARRGRERQPRTFRWGLTIGVAGATAVTAVRAFQSRVPATAGGAPLIETRRWVEPMADGSAPPSHPIKVKLTSGIYHQPGGFNYPRTKPDRCYVSAAAAEADGFRPSKR
jgi:hypothetical protein